MFIQPHYEDCAANCHDVSKCKHDGEFDRSGENNKRQHHERESGSQARREGVDPLERGKRAEVFGVAEKVVLLPLLVVAAGERAVEAGD